ncbi:MAG TPA: GNAT family N-acetyltransferase [Candidatus Limnocylindrales bacterium]
MGEITVRRAVAGDIDGLVACSIGLFAEDAGTRDPTLSQRWPREHSADSFTAQLDDASKLVLVADSGGSVAGHLTGSLGEPSDIRPIRVATLVSMFVMPQHRDAGVGGRLVAEFREWARAAGAQRLAVSAYATNEAAIRFYRRHGFAPRTLLLECEP